MIILKLLEKLILLPIWILLIVVGLCLKLTVHIYSVVKGIFGFVLVLLMIGTVICYQDWTQVAFLLCLEIITFLILVCGCFMEVAVSMAREHITKRLLS